MLDPTTQGAKAPELVERLRVADVDFHVTKSIDQCPPGLQARELLMNGVEAEMLDEENGARRIRLYAVEIDGVSKLAIWNSGRGMTADELIRATDLASSLRKKQGLDNMENRGEGAKVASLPWNHAGLRFRSCHHGRVSEVLLARVGDAYVRMRQEVIDDNDLTSYDAAWDVTEEALADGHSTECDWTEVVCMGRSLDQDTTRWPYGMDRGEGHRREVLTEIFDRFYSLPNHVQLEAHESLHGRKGSATFRLMKGVIDKWADDNSKLRSERVPLRDGIVIEFVHTPMLSGSNTVMGAHELTGQPTRAALVWYGETYDARIGADWRKIAAGFGLPHVHSVVSVFVHLPNEAAIRNGAYRVDLYTKDSGDKVEIEDFQSEIRMAMPQWVQKLVQEALRPRQASDMSAVRKELERRLREARIRPVDLNRPGYLLPKNPALGIGASRTTVFEDTQTGERLGKTRTKVNTATVLDPDAPSSDPGEPAQRGQRQGSVKRRRSIQTVTSAPEIIWLDAQEKVESEDLVDRAGKYDLATNTLYLNALYEAVQNKISKLETQFSQQVDWESVQDLVTEKVRAAMALHVGSIVVYALAKQGRPKWTETDWRLAFSPQSLTVAADQSDHLLGDIRTGLAVTSAFKAARVV